MLVASTLTRRELRDNKTGALKSERPMNEIQSVVEGGSGPKERNLRGGKAG